MALSLAATLIVKNEERFLPECLASLEALGDLLSETVIYDTGSSDATIAIAESWGARVERGYWDDDFARARNKALDMTNADWALFLDADERLHVDAIALRSWLEAHSRLEDPWDGFSVEVKSADRGSALPTASMTRIYRVATSRFEGRIHERVRAKPGREHRVGVMPTSVAFLTHEGYAGEGTLVRKAERNLRISALDVARCRDLGEPLLLVESLLHRARSSSVLGNWQDVVDDCSEARSLAVEGDWRKYAGEMILEGLFALGDLDKAERFLLELAHEGLDEQWLRWAGARLLGARGRYREALVAIRRVDSLRNGLGERLPIASVLLERFRIGVACRDWDDVAATAILLVAQHGVTQDTVHALVTLWRTRHAQDLVDLLVGAGVRREGVVAAFEAEGAPGLEVARLLRAAQSP